MSARSPGTESPAEVLDMSTGLWFDGLQPGLLDPLQDQRCSRAGQTLRMSPGHPGAGFSRKNVSNFSWPQAQCLEYIHTFGIIWVTWGLNVGKYPIHGALGGIELGKWSKMVEVNWGEFSSVFDGQVGLLREWKDINRWFGTGGKSPSYQLDNPEFGGFAWILKQRDDPPSSIRIARKLRGWGVVRWELPHDWGGPAPCVAFWPRSMMRAATVSPLRMCANPCKASRNKKKNGNRTGQWTIPQIYMWGCP